MRRWSSLLWLALWVGACAPETHFLGLSAGDASVGASADSEAVDAHDTATETVTAPEETDGRPVADAVEVAGPDVPESDARDLAATETEDGPGTTTVKDAGAAELGGDAVDGPSGQDAGGEALAIDASSATDLILRIDTGLDVGGGIDAGACPSDVVLVGGTDHCLQSATGQTGNLEWLVWSSNNLACMTTYDTRAAFSAVWNDSGDAIAELGPVLDGKKSHGALGTISAEFAESKAGTGGGYSYIGIHGWTTSPLREYYIVEDWFGAAPGVSATRLSTITVDGAIYDVYRRSQVGASPWGNNQSFDQYLSVRRSSRTCGHISVTEHFIRWEALGLTLGGIEDLKVSVETGGGSGRIDFSTAMISIR